MRSYQQLKSDLLHLSENCNFLRPATTEDITYHRFSDPPRLDPSDIDDGMYFSVNRTMDAVFGADVIKENLFTGCYGIELMLKWLDKAREHPTWDRNSDLLINVKLGNIREKMIENGALLPEPRLRPTPSPKATKGKKRRVISETVVSPIKIVNIEGVSPPAKRIQIELKTSASILHLDNEEDENSSDLEIISCSIVPSEKPVPSNTSSSTQSKSSKSKSAKKTSKVAPIQIHHSSNHSTLSVSKSKTSVQKSRPVSTVLAGCPLTSGEIVCTRCKLKDDEKGLQFYCHCGHKCITLPGGRSQNVEVHWTSKTCTAVTREIRQTTSASLFFSKVVPNNQPAIPKPLAACAGLNNKTWKRPKATRKILSCIKGASHIYHGCRPREVICKAMFGITAHSELDEEQRRLWQNQCKAEATWWINRSAPFQTIQLTKCLGTLPRVLLQGMH
ncbi:hypothetical protein DFH28DRAFT_854688, partial [Melampsora americana]